jgi:hypothetical protein
MSFEKRTHLIIDGSLTVTYEIYYILVEQLLGFRTEKVTVGIPSLGMGSPDRENGFPVNLVEGSVYLSIGTRDTQSKNEKNIQ